MTAFLEMYRAATPLIQAGIVRVEYQTSDHRRPVIILSGGGVRIMLTAFPDNIRVYITGGFDDRSAWFELKNVIRSIGKVRPDWVATPFPEPEEFEWASVAEISNCLVRNWTVLSRLGEKDFPPLEGLQEEDVEWRVGK